MWDYKYEKRKRDRDLLKEKVEAGKGIVGCEMHEINGWGIDHHQYPHRGNGVLRALFAFFFRTKYKNEER